MPPLVAFLYYLCLTLLAALGLFVWLRDHRSPLHQRFALGAAALFAWILTLFLYDRQLNPVLLGSLGRLNFVSSDLAVLSAYLFVQELTGGKGRFRRALLLETALLSLVTLATPLIDRAEVIQAGQRTTFFGSLFPLHVIHTVGYLGAAVLLALYSARNASRRLRGQLLVIGIGIGITAAVAVAADLVLPYGFRNFAFQDAGSLSTVLLLAAVGYAISVQRLFDIRIIIRKTVVLALLLATVHALYSGVILLVSDALPPGAEQYRVELEVLNIMVLAFGFEPLKKFLEKEVDRLLYTKEHSQRAILAELAGRLASATSLEQSLQIILRELDEAFHLEFSAVFILEPGEGGALKVKRLEHRGKAASAKLLSLIQEPVLSFLRNAPETVLTGRLVCELKKAEAVLPTSLGTDVREHPRQGRAVADTYEVKGKVAEELVSRQIAVTVPIRVGDQLTGLLAVGEGRSGEPLRKADLALLEGVGALTAIAIQKAQFYDPG